ncbi:MAG: hypothetical protein K6F82_06190 [Sphaerochaetaceae bacterium]|nr:hypothetical protein [Sphaerochaetaceae bacterium]
MKKIFTVILLISIILTAFVACEGEVDYLLWNDSASDDSSTTIDYSTIPLRLTFLSTNSSSATITFSNYTDRSVKYSTDGGTTWTDLDSSSGTITGIAAGTSVSLYATQTSNGSSYSTCFKIDADQPYTASGNAMSLLSSSAFATDTDMHIYAFACLFYGDTELTDASNLILPATTLSQSCYRSMFSGCTALTAAPELPATTLAQTCYISMFNGCTVLTTAPILPAASLVNSCYASMFKNCSNLTSLTCLATTNIQSVHVDNWLTSAGSNTSGTKTFYKNSSVADSSWTSGSIVPSSWTIAVYSGN